MIASTFDLRSPQLDEGTNQRACTEQFGVCTSPQAEPPEVAAEPQPPTMMIHILGSGAHSIEGEFYNVLEHGVRFLSPETIPSGTAIRIERPDGLILGEAFHSAPASDHRFIVDILFLEVLSNLSSLQTLLCKLRSQEPDHFSKSKAI